MARPFVGLAPFAETDAAYYFGRESERRVLVDNLLSSRLTLLYGESGAGKSSLLNAGVGFELRSDPEFAVVVFRRWRDDPVAALAEAIASAGGRPENGKDDILETILRQAADGGPTLLVLLDQFEEYFHYHPRETRFDDELTRVLNHPELPANFLISVREDWLAALDRFKGRIPGIFENYLRMQHLSVKGATEAIEGPLQQFNTEQMNGNRVTWDAELSGHVIRSILGSQATAERGLQPDDRVQAPYLQMVMSALWDREQEAHSRRLRVDTLEQLGGARHIYESHLGTTLERQLSGGERQAAIGMFKLLVTGTGRKQNQTARELSDGEYAGGTYGQSALSKLVETRILTQTPPPRGAAPDDVGYEFAHDVLAEAGLKLIREQALEEIQWRAEQAEWHAMASLKAARRLRMLLAALSVAMVLVIAAALVAWRANRTAQSERRRAERNASLALGRELVQAANAASLEHQFDRAVLLASQAVGSAKGLDEGLLKDATETLRVALVAVDPVTLTVSSQSSAWAPDGVRLAALDDVGLKIFDARTGDLLRNRGVDEVYNDVQWSPSGKWFLLLNWAGYRVVSATNAGGILRLPEIIFGAVWHPTMDLLAAVSSSGEVVLFSIPSVKQIKRWKAASWFPGLMRWSPDGSRLATAGSYVLPGQDEKDLRIWDVQNGRLIFRVEAFSGDKRGLAWSPDSSRLLTGDSGEFVLRDATDGRVLRKISETGDDIYWSSKGGLISLTSHAPYFRLLRGEDLGVKIQVPTLEQVQSTSWSPDARFLAVTGTKHIFIYSTDALDAKTDELLAMAHRKVKRDLTIDECKQYLHVNTCPPRP